MSKNKMNARPSSSVEEATARMQAIMNRKPISVTVTYTTYQPRRCYGHQAVIRQTSRTTRQG